MIFYTLLSENADLLEPLAKLGLHKEDVVARLEIVSEVDKAKARYITKKGVSQNATIAKKKAFKTLTKWMTQFFSIARNAFKQKPQLLKALGITAKK